MGLNRKAIVTILVINLLVQAFTAPANSISSEESYESENIPSSRTFQDVRQTKPLLGQRVEKLERRSVQIVNNQVSEQNSDNNINSNNNNNNGNVNSQHPSQSMSQPQIPPQLFQMLARLQVMSSMLLSEQGGTGVQGGEITIKLPLSSPNPSCYAQTLLQNPELMVVFYKIIEMCGGNPDMFGVAMHQAASSGGLLGGLGGLLGGQGGLLGGLGGLLGGQGGGLLGGLGGLLGGKGNGLLGGLGGLLGGGGGGLLGGLGGLLGGRGNGLLGGLGGLLGGGSGGGLLGGLGGTLGGQGANQGLLGGVLGQQGLVNGLLSQQGLVGGLLGQQGLVGGLLGGGGGGSGGLLGGVLGGGGGGLLGGVLGGGGGGLLGGVLGGGGGGGSSGGGSSSSSSSSSSSASSSEASGGSAGAGGSGGGGGLLGGNLLGDVVGGVGGVVKGLPLVGGLAGGLLGGLGRRSSSESGSSSSENGGLLAGPHSKLDTGLINNVNLLSKVNRRRQSSPSELLGLGLPLAMGLSNNAIIKENYRQNSFANPQFGPQYHYQDQNNEHISNNQQQTSSSNTNQQTVNVIQTQNTQDDQINQGNFIGTNQINHGHKGGCYDIPDVLDQVPKPPCIPNPPTIVSNGGTQNIIALPHRTSENQEQQVAKDCMCQQLCNCLKKRKYRRRKYKVIGSNTLQQQIDDQPETQIPKEDCDDGVENTVGNGVSQQIQQQIINSNERYRDYYYRDY